MMAVYSHVRRKALDEAAKALEPDARTAPEHPAPPGTDIRRQRVTSHVTSQLRRSRSNVIDFPKITGGPSRTRTCDLLVRRAKKGGTRGQRETAAPHFSACFRDLGQ